jgi:hypothetical protein
MARDLSLSKTYVLEAFKKVLKPKQYSFRWFPHTLRDDQKVATVAMAIPMLGFLDPSIAHALSWVLPWDEPRLDFSYEYEGKWALGPDPSKTKPKALLNAPRILVLVKWGVGRPALAEVIPPNIRVGTEFLCEFAIPIWKPA